MTSPSGGINFPVNFEWSRAAQALAALRTAAQVTAKGIGDAFQSIPTSNEGFTRVVDQIKEAAKAADDLKSKGDIRIQLRGENIEQVRQAFEATSNFASQLAGKKYTIQLTVSGDTATVEKMNAVRSQIQQATKGQTVNVRLELDDQQALAALKEMEGEFRDAEKQGVHVKVEIDTEAAKRNAKQAADEIQRTLDQAKSKADAAQRVADRDQKKAEQQARVSVSLDGGKTSADTLREILALGKQINGFRVQASISIDDKNLNAGVERARQLIQSLGKGDHGTIPITVKAENAPKVLNALKDDIEDLKRRGGNINVNINPSSARQAQTAMQQILGGAGRGAVAGSGIGGNLLIGANFSGGAAAGLGAAVAVQALTQAIIAGTQASVKYNSSLELTRNTFEFFTGSAGKAQAAMAELRKLAAQSPLSEQQTLETGASFLRITGGDVQRMQQLTELTTALASARPELGFERVQGAIQQLVSGDFEAFDDRMNIAVGTTRELARQGVSGMELYRRAVEAAGGSLELLQKNSQSFSTRLSNLQQSLEGINAALGRGFFEQMSEGIGQANQVLSDHQGAWEAVAEAAGRAASAGVKFTSSLILPDMSKTIQALEAVAQLIERAQKRNAPAEEPESAGRQQRAATRTQLTTQREDLSGQLAKEKKGLEDIEGQLKKNKAATEEIKAGYASETIELEHQIKAIEAVNYALRAQGLQAQAASVRASQKQEESLGDPSARADLAGQKFILDIQRERLQIQQRIKERAEAIGELEQSIARRTRDAELEKGKTALEALRAEAQAHQDKRQAALEAIREEMRARQEARQVALEALREEIRARTEARQVTLEALREEIRQRQEARQVALEAMREEIRARQEARQAALEALRDEIQARQDARAAALDAIREEIRARREAYDIQLQQQRDLIDAEERRYQNAERAADIAHRRSQERYRDQIEQLRDRDSRLSKQENGKTPAERELEALEKQSRERQRLQSIADAEAAVYNANTGRERRQAQQRLAVLRVEQEEARKKEALQEQAAKEKEARDARQEKRQEAIAALERKAQDEDRKYQRDKEERDEKHRQQQEQIQEQLRQNERAEAQRRREEDALVRAEEKKSRDLEKAEQAQIKAAEKADKAQQKAEEAAIRAAEQSARTAERAEQSKVREEEKKAKAEERADAEKLRQAEAAAKSLERSEAAKVRAEEAKAREAERADKEKIRAEEAKQKAAEDAERKKRQTEDDERDKIRLQRLKDMKVIEDQVDANRLKTLALINTALGAQAAHDAVIAEHLTKVAENLAKLDEILKQLKANDLRARLQAIELEIAVKLIDLEKARAQLEANLTKAQAKVDDLKKQIDDIGRQLSELNKRDEPVPGPSDPKFIGPKLPPPPPESTIIEWAKGFLASMGKSWGQIVIEGINKLLGQVTQAVIDYLAGEHVDVAQKAADWIKRVLVVPIQKFLGIESPSTLFIEMMRWVGEGIIQGLLVYNQPIAETLETPFIAFQDEYIPAFTTKFAEQVKALNEALGTNWNAQQVAEMLETPFVVFQDDYIPAFQTKFDTQVQETLTSTRTKWEAAQLAAMLETPFIEFQDQYMPAFITKLGLQGTEAAEAFTKAWVDFKIDTKLTIKVPSGFVEFGKKAGEAFCKGWQEAMSACSCPDCGATTTNPKQTPNPKRPGGGNVQSFRAVGETLPASAVSISPSIRAASTVGAGTTVGGNISIQVTNQITASEGMDTEALAERVTATTIDRIIDILDYTQRVAPDPVPRSQPGGL